MAHSNYSVKKYNEALEWIRKSIAADTGTNVFRYTTAMIQTLLELNRTEEASRALKDISTPQYQLTVADTLNLYRITALYFTKINKCQMAVTYYLKILKKTDIMNSSEVFYNIWWVICNNELADIYLKTNQPSKAEPYIKNTAITLKNAKTYLDPRYRVVFYDHLYKYDVATGNYKDAVKDLERHDKLQDSLFTVDKNNKIAELDIQYKTAQNEQSIRDLHNDGAVQQARLQTANLQRNITIGGVVIMAILSFLFYRNYKQKQSPNHVITQKNELLQHLVTEKEWLLKEVHNRVKNNLHSVISLLEAQAAYLESDALQAIENGQHRIYAMSLIHQKLYQSDDMKTIGMTTYIPELAQYLRDSFDTSRIHFNLKVDPIQLNASQAIPLGLIINEALTNSIKYAFPDGRRGEITVAFVNYEEKYKLEISDDGIAMPKTKGTNNKNSLGLELIKGLAKEIKGDIIFDNSNGVKIVIIFERDLLHNMYRLQDNYLESA
jgi:two-component sensor histidine kinase